MRNTNRARGLFAAVVAVALLVGGVSVASNMGFKFVPSVAATEFFNLSLPWNHNYNKANDLLNDIAESTRVARFTTDAKLESWTRTSSPPAFTLDPNTAYILEADATGISSAVIVGSHDPNTTLDFTASQWFNVSAPYHSTISKLNDILNDLEAQLGAGSIERVAVFSSAAKLESWTSTSSPGFNRTAALGEGVLVLPASTVGGYAWPHY